MLKQVGFQRITGLNTVRTLDIPDGAQFGWLQAEDQDVRITFGPGNPSDTVGAIIKADSDRPTELTVELLSVAEVIERVAGASLSVMYFGQT